MNITREEIIASLHEAEAQQKHKSRHRYDPPENGLAFEDIQALLKSMGRGYGSTQVRKYIREVVVPSGWEVVSVIIRQGGVKKYYVPPKASKGNNPQL